MPKYLDDVTDGDMCEVLPVRGSVAAAGIDLDRQATGITVRINGRLLSQYSQELSERFEGFDVSSETMKLVAAQVRRDFPAPPQLDPATGFQIEWSKGTYVSN